MAHHKKHTKKGFILLEAVVFVTLMMVLGAAMLSASYNDRIRSLEYSTNNQAYNAALSALQLLVDGESTRLLNGQDLQYLTSNSNNTELSTEISITVPNTTSVEIPVQIRISSSNNNVYTLTATATVGTQTETLQMVVQYRSADTISSLLYSDENTNINSVLYGSGLAGKLTSSNSSNTFRLTLGPDTDLYLFEPTNSNHLTFTDSTFGGNVLVANQTLTVKNSSVSGILVANSDLTITNSIFGNEATQVNGISNGTVNRLTGIYTTQTLTLTPGVSIAGDVYANTINYKGGCSFSENASIYFKERDWGTAVYGNAGNSAYSLADGYRRGDSYGYQNSTVNFKPLNKPLFNIFATPLRMYIPTFPTTMQHFTDGATPENNIGLYATINTNPVATIINSAPACVIDNVSKVGSVVTLQENATLSLRGQGPFYLMVFGSGISSTVQVDSGAQIYGCLQNVTVNIKTNTEADIPELKLSYVDPITLNQASILDAPASNGKTTPYFQLISIDRLVEQNTAQP